MKAKTINEIHSEAEKNLGLRPGATASIRNNRGIIPGAQGTSPGGFPMTRPGTGGMMPGMPGARKMTGIPGIDNDNWELPRTRTMHGSGMLTAGRGLSPLLGKQAPLSSRLLPQGSGGFMSGKTSALLEGSCGTPAAPSNYGLSAEPAAQFPLSAKSPPASSILPLTEKPLLPSPASSFNPDQLHRKTVALLEEYFSVWMLDEALQCVEELKAPSYHPEVVKEAISLALEKIPPCVDPVVKLLEHLLSKEILLGRDIGTGCLLYASMLDDLGIDLPKAPNNFGEIMGKLILSGYLDFKVLKEVLKKVGDAYFQKAIFDAGIRVLSSNPSGQSLLESQASEVEACCDLL